VAGPRLEQLIDRLENAAELDPLAAEVGKFWTVALRWRRVRDVLSGRQLGHALHPAAVLVTGGALLSATVLDVTGDRAAKESAQRLVGIGLLSATPTALAGWSDWMDTEQAEKRVGLVHAATNTLALTSYAISWWQRRRGEGGTTASVVGATALGLGGWLGGHLAFAQGVGVDTTAFQSGPAKWTDVAAASRVTDGLRKVRIDGVAILLTRLDGRVVAIADRCTHRGGPLSDGDRLDDCVVCPWHGSEFNLATGSVQRGPATRPQPTFEARERSGRVQIRRQEVRALRTNPT
jgi:nitrite reductase/ring-hydroxylating ferredoxin subunit